MKGGDVICQIQGPESWNFYNLNYENTKDCLLLEQYVWQLVYTHNVGKRNFFNGDMKQQFYGLLAQSVVCSLLGQPVPVPNDTFDKGVDLTYHNKLIDIKTTLRNVNVKENYPANLLHAQYQSANYINDYYIFCSFNMRNNILEILGGLPKAAVPSCGKLFSSNEHSYNNWGREIKAPVERWEIPQSSLIQFNSIQDLQRNL